MKTRTYKLLLTLGTFGLALSLYAQTVAQPPPVPAQPAPTAPAPTPADATEPSAPKPDEQGVGFKEMPLQTVVETLAAQAKIRIIIPEPLTGKITINLPGVEPKEALERVLESKNYLLVLGKDEVYTVQPKATESVALEVFALNYASVKEVMPAVKAGLTSQGKLEVTGNTIIVYDVPSNLEKLRKLVRDLDTRTSQVLIETRLFESVHNPKKELGFDWSSMLSGGANKQGGLRTMFGSGDPVSALGGAMSPFVFNIGAGGREPVAAVLSASQFNVVLRYLNSDQDTELIATPRVVTADNKEAVIKIVRQEPIPQFQFNTRTASFEISGFDYKDIGNILKVTPHINKDGFITLDIQPEVSTSTEFRVFQGSPSGGGGAGGEGGGGGSGLSASIPIINTRSLNTRVVLRNGDTLFIGGLIQTETINSYTKVPVIGDVPVLGMLFRSKSLEKTKRNLLIFITPSEVPAGGKTGLEDQAQGLKPEDVYTDDLWMPKDNAKYNPPKWEKVVPAKQQKASPSLAPKQGAVPTKPTGK